MYEVDCPDCRRTFDAAADAKIVRCPNCSLGIELVSPDEPGGGHGHGSTGEVYNEAPCPYCGGLLALAPSDESGLCSHCERPLRFDRGRAFKVVDERGPAEASRAAAGASPRRSSKSGMTEKAGWEWYDPDVQVNEHNAPVVELGPVDEGPSPQPETRRLVVTAQKDKPGWESRPIARKSVIRKKEVARPAARTTKKSMKKAAKKATKKRTAKKKSGKKAAKKKAAKKKFARKGARKPTKKRAAKKKSAKKAAKKRAGKKAAKKRSAKKATRKSSGKKAAKKSVKKKAAKGSSGRRSVSGSRGAR